MNYSTKARRSRKKLALLRDFVGNLTCVRAQAKVIKRMEALERQIKRRK